jgi:radical SAM protein with 4Fe4S-binding SPASM domain
VETDLLGVDAARVAALARAPIDVLSVHVPAVAAPTSEQVMGTAAYTTVLENVRLFVTERHAAGGRVPLLVPTFTKCQQNLGEMEAWYDQWLRAVGCAVVRGPSEHGGLVPMVGVADMAPPKRRPCARLASRVTVLSDGRIVSCDEDVLGRQTLGDIRSDLLADVWKNHFGGMRKAHALAQLHESPLCVACKEWHRP